MRLRAEAAPSYLWVPELSQESEQVELSREESHYLRRVCRARAGDAALATDGRGALVRLRVTALGERVRAEVESFEPGAPEHTRRRALLMCGPPEGGRADWLIEKLAELGVSAWQPLECARGRWRTTGGALARWRRLAVAALRQSRRRHLMELAEPRSLDELEPGLPADAARWVADPDGAVATTPPSGPAWTVGAVGPAGGFDDREKARLEGLDFRPIALSDGRLRAETAAVALAAWWSRGGA